MILEKSEVMSISRDVINRYALFILNKLGFREKPENLSVRLGDSYDHAFGMCFAFFRDQEKNELGWAVVVIYLSNITCIKIFDWLRLPRLCMFSRKLLERKVLHVLAHELRHFWQYYTGEHLEYRKPAKVIPRTVCVLEADAESWAEYFLSAYISNPRIAHLSL